MVLRMLTRVSSGSDDEEDMKKCGSHLVSTEGRQSLWVVSDPKFSADDCRAFASWFSPVIYVEKISAVDETSRFMVVFASTAHIEQLLKYKDISYENCIVDVCGVDADESVWNTMGDMMTYTSAAPILQMAQDGISVALSQLSLSWGGYLGNS